MIRAATDVGGTCTDLVYFTSDAGAGTQEIVTAKSNTTPPDYERGVMYVIAKSGVPLEEIAILAHRTTVVINALTERKGVPGVGEQRSTPGYWYSPSSSSGSRPRSRLYGDRIALRDQGIVTATPATSVMARERLGARESSPARALAFRVSRRG